MLQQVSVIFQEKLHLLYSKYLIIIIICIYTILLYQLIQQYNLYNLITYFCIYHQMVKRGS